MRQRDMTVGEACLTLGLTMELVKKRCAEGALQWSKDHEGTLISYTSIARFRAMQSGRVLLSKRDVGALRRLLLRTAAPPLWVRDVLSDPTLTPRGGYQRANAAITVLDQMLVMLEPGLVSKKEWWLPLLVAIYIGDRLKDREQWVLLAALATCERSFSALESIVWFNELQHDDRVRALKHMERSWKEIGSISRRIEALLEN